MKLIQISAGKGPLECEYAVGKYLEVFLKLHTNAVIKESYSGGYAKAIDLHNSCYKSVLIELPKKEEVMLGTVKWVCQSPFRKNHKRKNWFIDVSQINHKQRNEETDIDMYNKDIIGFETFRCGGKGGQNVNKVETGVRVIHIPTGIATISTVARTQMQNKKMAISKLMDILIKQNALNSALLEEMKWMEHEKIVRGTAFETFYGMEFLRK